MNRVAPLLYNAPNENDASEAESLEAEARAFVQRIRAADEAAAQSDTPLAENSLGANFTAELLQHVPKDEELAVHPGGEQKRVAKSPLAFLREKVSGFLNYNSSDASTKPQEATAPNGSPPAHPPQTVAPVSATEPTPASTGTEPQAGTGTAPAPARKTAPPVPNRPKLPTSYSQGRIVKPGQPPPSVPAKPQRLEEHSQQPAQDEPIAGEQGLPPPVPASPRETPATADDSPRGTGKPANTPPVAPAGAGAAVAGGGPASGSPQLTRESSVSKKIMGAASSLLRKAKKAAATVRGSVSQGHHRSQSDHPGGASAGTSSPNPVPTLASPRGQYERPHTHAALAASAPAGPPSASATSGSPDKVAESSSPSGSPPESPRESNSEGESMELGDANNRSWSSARSSRLMHPLNKRGSGGRTSDSEQPNSATSTPRGMVPSASAEDLAALSAQKKLEQQREEALQREVLDKFNLDGRIAQNEVRPMAGSTSSRERRRAAIFTKAVDRYSQLHSNVEEARTSNEGESDAVNIWEEVPEGNIRVDVNDGKQEVGAGTLNQLVKHMTSEHGLDGRFVNTFLLTYTSFTTPRMFLEKLKQRYIVPEQASLSEAPLTATPAASSSATADPATSSTPPPASHPDSITPSVSSLSLGGADPKKKLQLRVVNTLKKWLDVSFLDFNDELIGQVFEFVDLLKRDGNTSLASMIDNMLLTKLVGIRKKKERAYDSPPPPPLVPKVALEQLTFEDIELIELARQMTLWDHEMYTNIKASELLRQAWNKPHLRYRSPNVLEMIERFNSISSWVVGCVVRPETAKERARIFERFVLLAQQLRVLKNFNGMNAILSGLGSSAVFRLQTTKELLSARLVKKYDKLQALMSSSGNFQNYRNALRAAGHPAVPYLGNYLSALVFIEEGNPDFVNAGSPEAPRQLINFKKRRLVSRVIEEMRGYQVGGYYALLQVPVIVEFLNNLPEENEERLYDLSLVREPRKKA